MLFQEHMLFCENCIYHALKEKAFFHCGQRSNHQAILHGRSPNELSKALSLSVSYSETFCAFLFLLPFQKENKEPPTTPLHLPQGPTHPALAFLWLHAIEFS